MLSHAPVMHKPTEWANQAGIGCTTSEITRDGVSWEFQSARMDELFNGFRLVPMTASLAPTLPAAIKYHDMATVTPGTYHLYRIPKDLP